MNRLHFCLLIPLSFLAKTSFAQDLNSKVFSTPQILSSSGFEREDSESLSFSVGSLNSFFILKEQNSVSQNGIHQDTTAVAETPMNAGTQISKEPDDTARVSVYPNPFVDRLTLTIENFTAEGSANYHFELYDSLSILLHTKQVTHREELIVLNSIPKGMIVLLLYKNNQEIKSFKLIPSTL